MSESTWIERKVNWIAVVDNLPPIGRSVLAVDNCGQVHEAFRIGHKNAWKWQWAHGNIAIGITHWMEMPISPAQFELNRVFDRREKVKT